MFAVKSKGGQEVLHKAEVHLKARHSAERILRCWGGQSKGSFEELKGGIHKMLQACSLHINNLPQVLKHLRLLFHIAHKYSCYSNTMPANPKVGVNAASLREVSNLAGVLDLP